MVERTIIDLGKARNRRIAVWTPWGVVPTEKTRKKDIGRPVQSKHDTLDGGKTLPPRRLAS